MASKKTTAGSAKRFGPRCGRSVREKFGAIEQQHRGNKKCPYCNKEGARRQAAGIWHCRKCDSTFTGRAYSIK